MKKQFPNLLSGGRLFLAGVMGILPVSGAAFAVLYLLCGLTDVLDGWLARRLRAESEFGAKLDSATDVCFLCVSLVRLWPVLRPGVPVLLFAIGVACVRLCAAAAAWVRFGRPGFLHTWGNKLTGLLLFFWPPFQLLTGSGLLLYPLCLAAGVSAVEELLIECTARDWLPDRRSILFSTKQKID